MSVERGPKPASPLPWQHNKGSMYEGPSITAHHVGEVWTGADGPAIVHRVNNWDALCDEVEQLRADKGCAQREALMCAKHEEAWLSKECEGCGFCERDDLRAKLVALAERWEGLKREGGDYGDVISAAVMDDACMECAFELHEAIGDKS